MFVRNSVLALVLLGGMVSCAVRKDPTGGEKDEKAPKLLATSPAQGSTNVSRQTIELFFDERVRTKDLSNQLIISPSLDNPYTTKENKGRVALTFSKPFPPNTTLYFNFRDGIEDVTESNKAQNLSLTFSTGPDLDSASIGETHIIRQLDGRPAEGFSVGLYAQSDTVDPSRQKPNYLAKTDGEGHCSFRNLREGTYVLFAFDDRNKNNLFDHRKEDAAFVAEPITLAKNEKKPGFDLISSYSGHKAPKIYIFGSYKGYWKISANSGIKSLTIKEFSTTNWQREGDEIAIFAPKPYSASKDSTDLTFEISDSLGNSASTVLRMPPLKLGQDSIRISKALVTYAYAKGESIPAKAPAWNFSTAEPVKVTGPALVNYDSSKTWVSTPIETLGPNTFRIKPTQAARKYADFVIPATSLETSYRPSFRGDTCHYKILAEENTGLIHVKLNSKESDKKYILDLVTEQGQVVQRVIHQTAWTFTGVQPGTYRLRACEDTNADQEISGSNFSTKQQPEPCRFFGETILIKANFELDIQF